MRRTGEKIKAERLCERIKRNQIIVNNTKIRISKYEILNKFECFKYEYPKLIDPVKLCFEFRSFKF